MNKILLDSLNLAGCPNTDTSYLSAHWKMWDRSQVLRDMYELCQKSLACTVLRALSSELSMVCLLNCDISGTDLDLAGAQPAPWSRIVAAAA